MASAVRWPKSASKIAASASRRPVRRPRWRSASDTIDEDRHGAELQSEEPFDRGGNRGPDLCGQRCERLPGSRDDAQADDDPVVADPDADRGAGEPAAPGGPSVADACDARDLERGQADELGDDTLPDGQFRSAHVATPSRELG